MQTKKQSIIEVLTNTVVGLILSFIIQVVVYPLLDVEVSISKNILITFIFFAVSILRGYLLRRLFTRLFKKKLK